MWYKNVLLPLWAGLVTCMPGLNAKEQHAGRAKLLYFMENKGQITDQDRQRRQDLDFKVAAGNGLNLFIGGGHLVYQWAKERAPIPETDATVATYEMQRMEVRLIGANPKARIVKEGATPYFERYLLSWLNTGNQNAGVVASAYRKITYRNIYPNIDWVFYFNAQGQLEHDFIVHPGGQISDIQIQYLGADGLRLLPDGAVAATTAMGCVTERAPIAYQTYTKAPIASAFVLRDNHTLGFEVAPYRGTLTIDPVLEWGTYFGGPANEECFALTTDKWGAVYMAGSTGSVANIATTGAFQTVYGLGTTDAFVSKWNKEGQLLWATYLGGSNVDAAKGLACDTAGYVYVGGHTNSKGGIATVNVFQDTLYGGNADAFIVKMDSSGQRIWGTYYGGVNNEAQTSFGLATDPGNHVYITGNTQSTNLPVTSGVHQASLSAGIDVFVAKFSGDGKLGWSTFYGGPGSDLAYGIATDKDLNVCITGYTLSLTGIATSGMHQASIGGGQDAYVAQFNSSGQLNWGTYLGGTGTDRGYALSSWNDKIVIGGVTSSPTGIASLNCYQTAKNAGDDGFIALFNNLGILNWASYYGGEGSDAINGINIMENNLYVSGQSLSATNISTSGSIQETYGSGYDGFLLKFDLKGERIWATYYGGTGSEIGSKVVLDHQFNVYLGGSTTSGAAIATPNAAFSSLNGGYDAFLTRINDCDAPTPLSAIRGDTLLCSGAVRRYSIEADSQIHTYHWLLPEKWSGGSDSNQISLRVQENNGWLQVYARSTCGGISDTQSIHITVLPLPEPEIQEQNGILSTTKAYQTYQWLRNGEAIDGAILSTYIAKENGRYSVSVTNVDGCAGTSDSIAIEVLSIISPLQLNLLDIYPNPVAQLVTIASAEEGNMQLYSIDGKRIRESMPIHKGKNWMATHDLPSGVYLLRMQTNKGWHHQKLIKE